MRSQPHGSQSRRAFALIIQTNPRNRTPKAFLAMHNEYTQQQLIREKPSTMTATTTANCDEETGNAAAPTISAVVGDEAAGTSNSGNNGKENRPSTASNIAELDDDEDDCWRSLTQCFVKYPFFFIGLLLIAVGGIVSAFAPKAGWSMLSLGLFIWLVLCFCTGDRDDDTFQPWGTWHPMHPQNPANIAANQN